MIVFSLKLRLGKLRVLTKQDYQQWQEPPLRSNGQEISTRYSVVLVRDMELVTR